MPARNFLQKIFEKVLFALFFFLLFLDMAMCINAIILFEHLFSALEIRLVISNWNATQSN